MLELSSIKFGADTSALKEAIGTMNQVKTAIVNLDKAQVESARTNTKLARENAATAKAQAAEALAALRVQKEQIKVDIEAAKVSAITARTQAEADKASSQQALAAIKLEKEKQKAIDATVAAGNRSISVLEKQEQVLQFMVQGYSRGQSSILATAKAAGAATDELEKLGNTLQSQRTLMGSDPFDKSLGALRALKNEYSVVKEQVRLYNAELGLTKKQSEDLARDKLRLIEASKIEGKSLFSVRDSIKELNMEYIRLAKSENDLVAQYKASVKNTQDTAKANTYLETELQKVRFAVDEQNASMNRGSANALVRFENALKKSGKTAAEQKVLLDEYRKSLEKLQTAGAGRATDYISRAVGPQLTDIIVGLSTGQSLMTVMMQQGGQLRDQFAMMGVAGAEMGQVMRTALSSMAVSVKDTAKAFGQLFIGGVVDAGKAAVNFVSNITGLNAALDLSKRYFAAMGEEGFKYIGMMNKMGAVTSVFAGILMATGVGALVALGVAAYQTMKEQDKLAESLALYNGTLSISHSSSLEYVAALNKMGVTTGNASAAIMAMAKSGVFASDEIMLVAKSAATMADYSSVSVEDTIKVFAKLKEKPVEALLDVAKQTGMVSLETIKMVEELQKSGKAADASALAMQTYGDVTAKQVQQMKDNYSSFGLFVMELGKTIKQFFSETFKDLFYTSTSGLQKEADKLQALVDKYEQASTVGRVAMGDAFGYTNDANKARLNQLREQISQMKLQNAAIEDQNKAKSEAARIEEVLNKAFDKTEDSLDKQLKKTQTLSQWQDFYLNKKLEQYAKDAGVNKEAIKLTEDQINQTKALAKVEWDRAHKKDSAKVNKEMDTYLDTLNKVVGLSGSYNNDLKDLQSLRQKGLITEQEYVKAVEDLIAAQPFAVAQEKQRSEGLELINRLLGKGEGLGKDYYESMKKLEALKGLPNMDVKEIEAAQKALQATTPFAKAMSEWFAKGREAITKYTAEFKKTSDEIALQNKELDYQYSLFGLSEDQQKKVTIEYQKQVKLQKALNEYEANRIKILNDTNLNTDQLKNEARLQNEQEYAEKVRLINRETAYQYAAEQQKAFNEIRDGISGSIVEALFNGGKSGTQKLRNFLIEQLKKPVTLVVNAVVNTLLGSVIGSLVGGSSGSGGSGFIGTLLQGTQLYSGLTSGTGILGTIGGWLGLGGSSATAGLITGAGSTGLGLSAGASGLGLTSGGGLGLTAGSGLGTTAASTTGGLFSTIGSALPWIAGAAAIFSIISGLDDSGTYHTGGAARYSKANGLTSGASGAAYDFGFGEVVAGQSTITAMETLSKSLVEIFDGIAKTFGKTAGYEVATAFADDTSKDGAWGAFKISLQGVEILNWDDFRQSKWAPKEFGDGEEGYKQYLAAVASDTRKVLLDMDLPSWADQILTDLGDSASMESLTTAVQQIGVIKAAYDTLVKQVINFANITDDSFGALMEEFGGIENLASQVSSYYDQYYSETEKYQKLQAEVAKGFSDMGVTMPKSREEFRKLAEAQDLNTEAGRKAYAQIMSLAGSFDTLADKAEETAAQIASSRQDLTDRILEQEAALLEAQGRSEEAAKKRRELLDAQRARENAALMALDPELAKLAYQLWLLEDATTAVTDKISAANDAYSDLQTVISNQKNVLESQKTTLNTTITSLQQIFDLLKQNTRELYLQVDSTSSMLASQGRSVIASALAGGTVEYSTLSDAISAVRNDIDTTQYATQFEQDKARLQLAADLALLQETTDDSLTLARKQLDALEQEIEQLDEVLKLARQQLDAALGVKTAVMTVTEAVNNLNTAITELLKPTTTGTGTTPSGSSGTGTGGAVFGGGSGGSSGSSATTSPYSQVTSLGSAGVAYIPITDQSYISHLDSLSSIYQSYSGTGNLAGLLADIQAAGGSLNDLSALSGFYASDWRAAAEAIGVKPFANGGVFTNSVVSSPTTFGMGLMGEAGPEAIMPLANVGGSLGVRVAKDSSDDALEKRVENLSIELQAIAVNTSKVARILERVTRDGESLLTTPAP